MKEYMAGSRAVGPLSRRYIVIDGVLLTAMSPSVMNAVNLTCIGEHIRMNYANAYVRDGVTRCFPAPLLTCLPSADLD